MKSYLFMALLLKYQQLKVALEGFWQLFLLSLVLGKWPLWHLHHHLFCFPVFHFMPDSYADGLQGAQPKDESYECS